MADLLEVKRHSKSVQTYLGILNNIKQQVLRLMSGRNVGKVIGALKKGNLWYLWQRLW